MHKVLKVLIWIILLAAVIVIANMVFIAVTGNVYGWVPVDIKESAGTYESKSDLALIKRQDSYQAGDTLIVTAGAFDAEETSDSASFGMCEVTEVLSDGNLALSTGSELPLSLVYGKVIMSVPGMNWIYYALMKPYIRIGGMAVFAVLLLIMMRQS